MSEAMIANMVASAPRGAVRAMRASIGTMLELAERRRDRGVDEREGARAKP